MDVGDSYGVHDVVDILQGLTCIRESLREFCGRKAEWFNDDALSVFICKPITVRLPICDSLRFV